MQYIDLKISALSAGENLLSSELDSENEYFERLDYFVTYAQQDIRLIQGKDSLSPALYHFERNYGLAPYNTLLLGFELGEQGAHRDLIIDDKVLGIGRVKFFFDDSDISNSPKLKCI